MRVLIQMALCKPSVVTHTVIPALGKQRQEDYEFEASLGYIVRSVSKTKSKENKKQITVMNQYRKPGQGTPQWYNTCLSSTKPSAPSLTTTNGSGTVVHRILKTSTRPGVVAGVLESCLAYTVRSYPHLPKKENNEIFLEACYYEKHSTAW